MKCSDTITRSYTSSQCYNHSSQVSSR